MKMKSIYALLIGMCISASAVAQKSYKFTIDYKDNTTYKTTMKNDGNIVMDIEADEEMKSQLEAAGQKFPMNMTTKQSMDSKLMTESTSSEAKLPVKIVYGEMKLNNTLNGQEQPNNQENPLKGLEVLGVIENGKISIEDIKGGNVTPEIKNITKSTMEKLFDIVQFPENGLKIGDEFTVDMPFSIPVMGKSVEIAINTTYQLKDVKNSLATFDIVQSMKMDTSLEGAAMSASGNGTGTLIFDMSQDYYKEYTTNLKMKMKVNIPTPGAAMKMVMDMDMVSNIKVDIAKN